MRRNSFPIRHPSQHDDKGKGQGIKRTKDEAPVQIDEAGSLSLAQFLQEVVADSAHMEELDETFQKCDKYRRRVELCVHVLKTVVPQLCPRLVSTQRTFSALSSYLCTALYSNQEET